MFLLMFLPLLLPPPHHPNSFYINSSTGEIQTAVVLNRELVEQYNLVVTAVDSDADLLQRRSSTVQVSVTGERLLRSTSHMV